MRFDKDSDGTRARVGLTTRARLWLAAGLGLLLVLACVGGAAARSTATKPVLRIGLGANITDWHLPKVQIVNPLTYGAVYGTLFHQKSNGEIVGHLVSSWRYLKAKAGSGRLNKDFEFTLRKDAGFSNGTPVTAQAVVSYLTAYAVPGVNLYSAQLGPNPKFEAVGRWTVRVHLTVPNALLPLFLSDAFVAGYWGFVEAPEAVANPALVVDGPIGAGQYMYDRVQSVAGSVMVFVPNPHYFDQKAIKWSRVEFRLIANATSTLQALQAGQIDVAGGDPTTADAAAKAGFRVPWASTGGLMVALDTKHHPNSPLNDVRVRQAINYAIDRKAMTNIVPGGYSKPFTAMYALDADPLGKEYYPYDPAKARSLLAASGYANGFTLKLLGTSTGLTGPLSLGPVSKNLEAVGIRTELTFVVGTAYATNVFTFANDGFVVAFAFGLTPARFGTMMNPAALLNVHAADPEAVKLFYRGLKAAKPGPIWKQFWLRVNDQAYWLPMVTSPSMMFVSKSVGGVVISIKRPNTALMEWFPR